ncbi:hypothetical protein QUV83_01675 [Cellulomonas cellasea]|uniref:hypothetical protein n=1 Tax=Cellulomonas cellasea TaxID=43670 RepID=UPI0025A32F2D|nr:hypothetical protein [Cellulomonas cellasea]MDM8083474.1 hypothetical protein [Cellulomonas cellasea]
MVRVTSVRRRFALVGAVALVSAGLAGCSATNEITTQLDYAASDGVRATLGDVTAENLLIITAGKGEEGALQGAFTNRGSADVDVTLTTEDDVELASVPVAAGTTVLLGGTRGEVVTFTTPVAPGATLPVTLSSGAAGTEALSVPVLDGTLSEYTDLVPTATPSATATATPSPTATETATETATPTAG